MSFPIITNLKALKRMLLLSFVTCCATSSFGAWQAWNLLANPPKASVVKGTVAVITSNSTSMTGAYSGRVFFELGNDLQFDGTAKNVGSTTVANHRFMVPTDKEKEYLTILASAKATGATVTITIGDSPMVDNSNPALNLQMN